jgi:hypothetical protein
VQKLDRLLVCSSLEIAAAEEDRGVRQNHGTTASSSLRRFERVEHRPWKVR